MLYGDLFSNMNAQYKNVFEPYTKFNSLVAKNFADLTNLQLEAARNYANIGLAQMFANSEVKDMQSMVNCTTKQLETMNKLSQQMIEDGYKFYAKEIVNATYHDTGDVTEYYKTVFSFMMADEEIGEKLRNHARLVLSELENS